MRVSKRVSHHGSDLVLSLTVHIARDELSPKAPGDFVTEQSDRIRLFIGECLVPAPGRTIQASEAYDAFSSWWRGRFKEEVPSLTFWGRRMSETWPKKKSQGGRILYVGVGKKGEGENDQIDPR